MSGVVWYKQRAFGQGRVVYWMLPSDSFGSEMFMQLHHPLLLELRTESRHRYVLSSLWDFDDGLDTEGVE